MSETRTPRDFQDQPQIIHEWLHGFCVDTSSLVAELQRWAHELHPADAPYPIRNALDEDEAEAVLETADGRAANASDLYTSAFLRTLNDLGVVLVWERPSDRIEFQTRGEQ